MTARQTRRVRCPHCFGEYRVTFAGLLTKHGPTHARCEGSGKRVADLPRITLTDPPPLPIVGQPAERGHLSPSQLDYACGCGIRWCFKYEDRLRMEPPRRLVEGSGVHVGAALNFRQKIETHDDLPVSDIVDAAVDGFDARLHQDGVALTDEEAGRGRDKVLGESRDRVVRLAKCFAEQVAPRYQPRFVEQEVRITDIPGAPFDLLGYLDLADVLNRVRDIKSASRKTPQAVADHSTQLTFYSAAHHVLTGRPATDVGLEVLIDYKSGPQAQSVTSERGPDDWQVLAERINAFARAKAAGAWLPAPPSAWWCSIEWCEYARVCPHFNSERKAKTE